MRRASTCWDRRIWGLEDDSVSSLKLKNLTFSYRIQTCFLQRLVPGLLFSFSWQLNTNNSTADELGFAVFAQGGVQDMTGVINDRALCLAWQRNRSTICMCSTLPPSLGVIGTQGEACSSFLRMYPRMKSRPSRTRHGKGDVSWYHAAGQAEHMSDLIHTTV